MLGLESFSPTQIAFGRLFIGSIALWCLVLIIRSALPSNKTVYGHLFLQAMMLNSIPGVLFATAEQHVSSIVAGIFNGTTPLFALLATLTLFREQSPTRSQKLGLLIGFAGVLIVLGIWEGVGQSNFVGFVLLLIAVSGYGISFPYSRRYIIPHGVPPVTTAAIQVSFGALQLLPFVAFSKLNSTISQQSLLAVVALGLLSTGLAYVLHFRVLAVAGAIIASTVAYWTPLVAGIAGYFLLGEGLTWREPLGAVIILLGLLVAQERLHFSRR